MAARSARSRGKREIEKRDENVRSTAGFREETRTFTPGVIPTVESHTHRTRPRNLVFWERAHEFLVIYLRDLTLQNNALTKNARERQLARKNESVNTPFRLKRPPFRRSVGAHLALRARSPTKPTVAR